MNIKIIAVLLFLTTAAYGQYVPPTVPSAIANPGPATPFPVYSGIHYQKIDAKSVEAIRLKKQLEGHQDAILKFLKQLEEQKTQWINQVDNARISLKLATEAKIKAEVANSNWKQIKIWIDDIEQIDLNNEVSTSNSLEKDKYLQVRKVQDSALFNAYQNCIQNLKTIDLPVLGLSTIVSELESERDSFIKIEQDNLKILPPPVTPQVVKNPPEDSKPQPKNKTLPTKDLLNDFYKQHTQMLQEIDAQTTTVKKKEICDQWIKKIDAELKTQSWEFSCTIKDIHESSYGKYHISHNLANELPEDLRTSEWRSRISGDFPIPKSQALTLGPDDLVIYSGTPYITLHPYDNTSFLSFNPGRLHMDQETIHYTINLRNPKVRFEKKK